MAKPDWSELQDRFLSEHAESGVSPKEWCESQGLNYATARRYIKKTAQSAQKSAQRKTRSAQKQECAEKLIGDNGLSDQVRLFIVEYLKDQSATHAAIRAGYSKKTAAQIGYQLLQKPSISQAIAEQQKKSLARTIGTADEILSQMWQLATFDANELSQYRRGCCRHCWGIDHNYQWTEFEYRQAAEKAERMGKEPPDDSGGLDYNRTIDANPDCPVCSGEGVGRVYMQDTRKLSPIARLAYSGTKVTKGGIEVVSISREKMFEAIIKRMGLSDSEIAQKLQQLELERRQLEIEKLRKEISAQGSDQPITRMEVVIVGENNQNDPDPAAG
ncbi:terminase small subunit [Tatumella sp. JGM118]|uniref:terminase small subunit n=1 Tax=Tatumella sp. JGM118 TaxID=2799796 RepID=UPI001BB04F7D|nr:terminase small subunit [Tatumella sp. JGM118]MBS0909200.1 terminase small subunit [Tatumella sp. JGM118]